MSTSLLLSVADLKDKLRDHVVVDGSWHMPAAGRDPLREFEENGHIPGGTEPILPILIFVSFLFCFVGVTLARKKRI